MASFSTSNAGKPAPKWWRKLENGLLMILIPATVAILMGWDFKDEAFANKLILLINTGLVALIKFIGNMLANGEVYASDEKLTLIISPVDQLPTTGENGVWYLFNGNYYFWSGSSFVNKGGDRPTDPPVNP